MSTTFNPTPEQLSFIRDVASAISNSTVHHNVELNERFIKAMIPAAMRYVLRKNREHWENNKEQVIEEVYNILKEKGQI